MTFLDSIILGIVQGLTEFLPISSSGHLVLGQQLLHINAPGNLLEVVLHVGSLFSILVVFYKDIFSLLKSLNDPKTRLYIGAILVGTIPAVIVGLGFKDQIEHIFDSVTFVSINLCITGLLLWLTRYMQREENTITMKSGLMIGIAQACAILPGISRSGSTIALAMYLKISQEEAAKFSFLLAIPALVGAGLLTALDGVNDPIARAEIFPLMTGFMSSFIIGWISLKWLLRVLQRGHFHWFGIYCFIIGIITLIVL